MSDLAAMLTPVRLPADQSVFKRRIKPSPEKQHYHGSKLMISPQKRAATEDSGSPTKKRVFAGARAMNIGQRFTAPASSQDIGPALKDALNTHCEILFEEFDIVRPDGSTRILSTAESIVILSLFDTAHACDQGLLYIVIRVKQLPPKPWPFAICGMPLFITASSTEEPPGYEGLIGMGPILFAEYTDKIQANLETILQRFCEDFISKHKLPGSGKMQIRWYGKFFEVELPHEFDIKTNRLTLPGRIAQRIVRYVNAAETQNREFARHHINPDVTAQVRDDTNYGATLRPGIMVSNGENPMDVLSTSGAAVAPTDKPSHKYVTLAHHGFNHGLGASVYHPDRSGVVIGDIRAEFPNLDIDLMHLRPGITYEKQMFFGDADSVKQELSTIWERGLSANTGDMVQMNSPFSGHIEGVLLMMGVEAEGVPKHIEYTEINSMYIGNGQVLGNDMADIVAGICGTPVVLKKTNEVIGFFRYLNAETGVASMPDAFNLTTLGYQLTTVP